MRLYQSTLALAAMLAGPLHASAAEKLPDGTYRCEMYSGSMLMHLGDIEISGSNYRGPASDGNYGDSYAYELTEAGTINWGGPMGGFDSDGNRIVSTVLKRDGDAAAFDVMLQLKSGNFSTISCSLQA